ncbi:M14 family zinc carboxypeptidase [Halalkalibacter akibai]|uniref:Gamma-D-glutamyl-L-diamino acid endopeptidase n=1 Tax=Halalkalibacter akibai (strain ATCC 43226 / DSM 21942 / CIP 109018 / JCM 9157 / 1139) TaxID=1236973 RepID=W4QUP1_HALA3|nr:M14 family zinc carboxypeptidase [Halalkalibacter akibai]GAE35885.1 gamma-D-glutamyl-L-diamino acid endopeptidase [Halalkalibacter akibai JCM 9157]
MKYTVQKGDTLAKVAYLFKVRPFDLLLFNPHIYSEQSYLYPGLDLHVPSINRDLPLIGDDVHTNLEFGQTDIENKIPELRNKGIHVEIIGYSVMNQPLYAFKIGEGKKEIFYSGGWHANEWHTSKFLVQYIEQLAEHKQNKTLWNGYDIDKILNDITLYIVPLVNPDGVDLVLQGIYPSHPYYEDVLAINKGMKRFEHWSSNIRGVDLNHQWPAGWEIEAVESPQEPWSRHYSGKAPLTEPEAMAVYTFTNKHSFSHVLAFHSQGQVIYWGYRGMEPLESKEMVERLSLLLHIRPFIQLKVMEGIRIGLSKKRVGLDSLWRLGLEQIHYPLKHLPRFGPTTVCLHLKD